MNRANIINTLERHDDLREIPMSGLRVRQADNDTFTTTFQSGSSVTRFFLSPNLEKRLSVGSVELTKILISKEEYNQYHILSQNERDVIVSNFVPSLMPGKFSPRLKYRAHKIAKYLIKVDLDFLQVDVRINDLLALPTLARICLLSSYIDPKLKVTVQSHNPLLPNHKVKVCQCPWDDIEKSFSLYFNRMGAHAEVAKNVLTYVKQLQTEKRQTDPDWIAQKKISIEVQLCSILEQTSRALLENVVGQQVDGKKSCLQYLV